jgi:D-cysteine desulfhydrase
MSAGLACTPTPVARLDRLAAHLDMAPGSLWVKRDDLTGLAGGGNKARKLDVLCADAMTRRCDVLVTGGGPQSNHARMTAAAACKLGLDCVLVLSGDRPDAPTGNVLLDRLLGAVIEWVPDMSSEELDAAIDGICARLERGGRRPYAVPVGGSNPLGSLGYVAAARELSGQVPDVEMVVVATGSCGTHAGLAAGLGDHGRVLGVRVGERVELEERVAGLAQSTATLAELNAPAGAPVIDHRQLGPGYAAPSETGMAAIELAARLEGLVLDPVYTGKAMAGLVAARADGRISARTRTVFLHTGGLPGLFADRFATCWDVP